MWCIPELTDEFVEQMMEVLELYERAYKETEPIVCLDEKSTQLLEHSREPLPMKPGRPKRIDSEYVRKGTATAFLMVEPKAGKRYTFVRKRRTKKDYALCLEKLVEQYYGAERIHVVQDNLNTHSEDSLVETFGEEKAQRIMNCVEFHFTPVHGSWLNMAEIEIGIMETECLGRRLPNMKALEKELKAWEKRRNERRKMINWRFSREDARKKFNLGTRHN
ncbi:hypothetical protein AKJ62_03210 [candidate division MSBL1 archaeon SCGC-AAA259D14]|uniref:Tc1-like transposase DDE domain-containing protein n=1 Tax=candidate division MSBL1 archaeon SCGC-AAA259D14 TaxID=1698261 RepID=A0A133U5C0_9EURY|nr:hypothetical protein AKJ62_03210 [candidate division MSBL1 archaeon SCGC-AAA259D14]